MSKFKGVFDGWNFGKTEYALEDLARKILTDGVEEIAEIIIEQIKKDAFPAVDAPNGELVASVTVDDMLADGSPITLCEFNVLELLEYAIENEDLSLEACPNLAIRLRAIADAVQNKGRST